MREAIQYRAHLKPSRHTIGKSAGFRAMRTPRGRARVEELLRLLGELDGHLEVHSIDVQFPSTADLSSPSTALRTNDRLVTLTRRNNGTRVQPSRTNAA